MRIETLLRIAHSGSQIACVGFNPDRRDKDTTESLKAHTDEMSSCFVDRFIGKGIKAADYQAICELTAAPFRYAPTKHL